MSVVKRRRIPVSRRDDFVARPLRRSANQRRQADEQPLTMVNDLQWNNERRHGALLPSRLLQIRSSPRVHRGSLRSPLVHHKPRSRSLFARHERRGRLLYALDTRPPPSLWTRQRWAFMEVRLNRRRRVCNPPYHTVLFIVSLSQLARIACLRETCSRFGLRYYRYLSAFVRNSAHSVNLMTVQFGAAIKISFWDQSYDRRKKECICWKGSKF